MRAINIYVEGLSDLLFISHFLSTHFSFTFELDPKVIHAYSNNNPNLRITLQTFTPKTGQGGIDDKKIRDLIYEIKTVNEQKGIESILIIDADTPNHKSPKGGFCSRKEYLDGLLKEAGFKYFIVPTHKDDGNLEAILDSIVSSKGQAFYACLTKYIDGLLDLKEDNIPKYVLDNPNLTKEKINWYIYMMLGKLPKDKKEFINPEIWNLNSSNLEPLKVFFNGVLV